MLRLFHTIIVGLIGAGIVHGAAIMLMPDYGGMDLWTRLQPISADGTFTILDEQTRISAGIALGDPLSRRAVCRFSIENAPVRITAQGDVAFWSVSVFDRQGYNRYSVTDQTASERNLELLVATPLQMIELRKAIPEQLNSLMVFERDMAEAFVIVSVLQADESWVDLGNRFLSSAKCEPFLPASSSINEAVRDSPRSEEPEGS